MSSKPHLEEESFSLDLKIDKLLRDHHIFPSNGGSKSTTISLGNSFKKMVPETNSILEREGEEELVLGYF